MSTAAARPAKKKSRPLTGVRVLVTRAKKQSGTLARDLRAQGAVVLEIPAIEIRRPRSYRPLDHALLHAASYDWLILTSVNGVAALAARLKKLRRAPATLAHLKIAAIGPATRAAIEQLGLKVTVMPGEYVAEGVLAALAGQAAGKRVLLVRARVARDVLPNELRRSGSKVDVIEAYRTIVPTASRTRLRRALSSPRRRPHVITFTSSSTVRNFLALLGARPFVLRRLEGILLASIGPVTSSTLCELGLPVGVEARTYTMPGLVQAIIDAMAARGLG